MIELHPTQSLSRKGQHTRIALIHSGVEAMTTHGYISANIESILNKVGVPKGSFYYYFKSKQDFGLAILDNYNHYFIKKLQRHLCNEHIPIALDRIKAFCHDARDNMAKFQFNRGCLVGELMQDESLLPPDFPALIDQILNNWQNLIANCLQLAQQQHEINSAADCAQLAYFFWLGWEGAVSRAKLLKNATPLDTFTQQFFGLLASP